MSSPLSLLDLEVNVVQATLNVAVVREIEMGHIDSKKIGRMGRGSHAGEEKGKREEGGGWLVGSRSSSDGFPA